MKKSASCSSSNFWRRFLSKFKLRKNDLSCFAVTQENSKLTRSLYFASQVMSQMASEMYNPNQIRWKRSFMGYNFSLTRSGSCCAGHGEGTTNLVNVFKNWLRNHEEAQVMVASVLVVVGLWWLVRTILALILSLILPVFVVLVAVIFVPQLRDPLLGQNYPALANIIRNILIKMAENIKDN
ncbi:hypothetical protein O0L34_g9800 [Tuta absoluta]|nr:hypothetical protein O0L34_g9800 [Tuta absoluta]